MVPQFMHNFNVKFSVHKGICFPHNFLWARSSPISACGSVLAKYFSKDTQIFDRKLIATKMGYKQLLVP